MQSNESTESGECTLYLHKRIKIKDTQWDYKGTYKNTVISNTTKKR